MKKRFYLAFIVCLMLSFITALAGCDFLGGGGNGDKDKDTPTSYSVSFDSQNGEAITKINDIEEGAKISAPTTDPKKTGYDFDGWYKEASCQNEWIFGSDTVTKNLTLYAKWDVVTYTITYTNAAGAINSNPASYTIETDTINLIAPQKTGYSGVWDVSTIAKGSTGDMEITAQWTANTYLITYDANGGEGIVEDTVHTYDSSKALAINSFIRDGYIFSGWNESMDGEGIGYAGGATVLNLKTQNNATLKLFAKWTPNLNTISFNANGGSGSMDDQQLYTDQTAALNVNTYIRRGYDFMGWATSGTGEVVCLDEAQFTMSSEDSVVLYAIWSIQSYSITYRDKGDIAFSGTHVGNNPTLHTYGTETNLVSAEKQNFSFDGWFTNANCTELAITFLAATNYIDDIILYAKWTADSYEISYFDINDEEFSGTCGGSFPILHTYDTATDLIDSEKDGYLFDGWFISSEGTGVPITILHAGEYTANITLYAKWTAKTYTISYFDMGNDEFSGVFDDQYPILHTYDQETDLISPTRDGFVFGGWFTASDCTGTALEKLGKKDYLSDIKLYAKWQIKYIDKNGAANFLNSTEITELKGEGDREISGWIALTDKVTGNFKFTIVGEAHIILADNCEWTVNSGIIVSEGNTLNIYVQSTGDKVGKLSTGANIGGGNKTEATKDNGTIIINGGIITAAAIGGANGTDGGNGVIGTQSSSPGGNGGRGGNGEKGGNGGNGGTIIINGGTVMSTNIGGGNGGKGGNGGNGGMSGSALNTYGGNGGNAGAAGVGGDGGNIVINGGTINATHIGGGNGGSGGRGGSGGSGGALGGSGIPGANTKGGNGGAGGSLTINGGTVVATYIKGGTGGAAGSSSTYDGTNGANATVVIIGGSVNAAIYGTVTNGEDYGNQILTSKVFAVGVTEALIESGTVSGADYYGFRDVKTDIEGKLYFWLPEGSTLSDTVIDINHKFSLAVGRNIDEAGAVSGGGRFAAGTTVEITAETNEGYTWIGWHLNDELVSTDLIYEFEMSRFDVAYEARWGDYNITLGSNMDEAGAVSGGGRFVAGTTVEITAETNEGYTWIGWHLNDELVSTDLIYEFEMPSENVVYEARWGDYNVTLGRNIDEAGAVSGGGRFVAGTTVEITAETNEGYTWIGWHLNDELVSTDLSYEFEMPSKNVVYEARWGIGYLDENGEMKLTGDEGITLISEPVSQTLTGWYILTGTVSITELNNLTLTVSGTVHLILADGCDWGMVYSYQKNGGISVPVGSTLYIYAQSDGENTGKLSLGGNIGGANGATGAMGTISTPSDTGAKGANAGTIIINGGKITVANIGGGNGGNGGAGRNRTSAQGNGAGGNAGNGGNGGNATAIIINGGNIAATNIGGGNGGIGGTGGYGYGVTSGSNGRGGFSGAGGNGGNATEVIINGGTVQATFIGNGNGGNGGAGVKAGNMYYVAGQDGNAGGHGGCLSAVTINGGIIEATNIVGGNGGTGGNGGNGYNESSDPSGKGGQGGLGGYGMAIINGGDIIAVNIGGGNVGNAGYFGYGASGLKGNAGVSASGESTIIISGGKITATNIGGGNGGRGASGATGKRTSSIGGNGGDGADGGNGGGGGIIKINGGIISVAVIGGGDGGSGGGGGYGGTGSILGGFGGNGGNGGNGGASGTISIKGGTISAIKIGGGLAGAAGIGAAGPGMSKSRDGLAGIEGADSSVVIQGGSVKVTTINVATNGEDNENQTLSLVTIETDIVDDFIESGSVAGAEYYSFSEVKTDEDGKVYLWLPAVATKVTINDIDYEIE